MVTVCLVTTACVCRRVCGRKRKGTPVKVCDRAYVTEDEEESMSEHSYSPGNLQAHSHPISAMKAAHSISEAQWFLPLQIQLSGFPCVFFFFFLILTYTPEPRHSDVTFITVQCSSASSPFPAGDGQYPEGAEDRLPPPGSPYYLADPSQLW